MPQNLDRARHRSLTKLIPLLGLRIRDDNPTSSDPMIPRFHGGDLLELADRQEPGIRIPWVKKSSAARDALFILSVYTQNTSSASLSYSRRIFPQLQSQYQVNPRILKLPRSNRGWTASGSCLDNSCMEGLCKCEIQKRREYDITSREAVSCFTGCTGSRFDGTVACTSCCTYHSDQSNFSPR